MLSIICLLIFFAAIAALMSVAFRGGYRPGPRGTIDLAAYEEVKRG
jgi:hypothetical protein